MTSAHGETQEDGKLLKKRKLLKGGGVKKKKKNQTKGKGEESECHDTHSENEDTYGMVASPKNPPPTTQIGGRLCRALVPNRKYMNSS